MTCLFCHHLATVQKLINEMMPEDITCAKDTRDLLIDCCVEFIHLLASEANDICEKETKKTIAAEHVITALKHQHVSRISGSWMHTTSIYMSETASTQDSPN
ncbi:negative cofactor 2 transcription regulator complex subunit ncb2 [Linnemannia zychae]|nr:negative cofactor 2 transcription regulator complex subunit ncb2 [Linnemannia zychae]